MSAWQYFVANRAADRRRRAVRWFRKDGLDWVRAASVAVVVAACQPAPPASLAAPSKEAGAGEPGLTWMTANRVDRPTDAFTTPAQPSAPTGPGTAGHPGHFPGQAVISDAVNAGDWLTAVGYSGIVVDSAMGIPDWQAVSWRSSDGLEWDLALISDGPGAFASGVDASGSGLVLAGGRKLGSAMTWTTVDGTHWDAHDLPSIDPAGTWQRVTTVATGHGTFVAGGSAGPELFERTARFWRSGDGIAWTAVPADPVFDGTEVTDILPLAKGWLALGRIGTGQATTGSVAWLSEDAATWRLVRDPALLGGWARSLASRADGIVVAVGSANDERSARAWVSSDQGETWVAAPEADTMTWYGRKIRMLDVTATTSGFVAVGNLVEMQFGTGVSWVSSDGLVWRRSTSHPPMGQAELEAVVSRGDRMIAVGTFGAPDNYIPRVWISPPN
jgi:hypothetical protein